MNAPPSTSLSLDERIQRKLNRENATERRTGRRRGELAFSLPPQSSVDMCAEEESIEHVRRSLIEKRKNMPITKHLTASMKMTLNKEELAKLATDNFSDDEEEETKRKGWDCTKCTFLNENEEHLACSVCGEPRFQE